MCWQTTTIIPITDSIPPWECAPQLLNVTCYMLTSCPTKQIICNKRDAIDVDLFMSVQAVERLRRWRSLVAKTPKLSTNCETRSNASYIELVLTVNARFTTLAQTIRNKGVDEEKRDSVEVSKLQQDLENRRGRA